MTSPLPVTVIVRCAGERTAGLCRELLTGQIPDEQITCIQETPFSRAVQRTFEIGLEAGRKWTLAIDADVLVHKSAVVDLLKIAEQLPDHVFEFEGQVFDRLFYGPRDGGPHVYRTSMLTKALTIACREETVHRPEFHVIKEMEAAGYPQVKHDIILGLHDFEQSYQDLYRKGFVHAQKHVAVLQYLEPMWRRLAEHEQDFVAAVHGMESGRKAGGIAHTDIRMFAQPFDECLQNMSLVEKPPIVALSPDAFDVDVLLSTLEPKPEFCRWDRNRRYGPPSQRFLRHLVGTIPYSIRQTVRRLLGLPVRPDIGQ